MRLVIAESDKNRHGRWPSFYTSLFLAVAILIVSTVLWVKNVRAASETTINDLGEFYLEEITERNTRNITLELEKKTSQMEMALNVMDQEYLKDETSIRKYIHMVQQINGLDMFALVDENGMVYTADSSFSGISRFSFLSEEITEPEMHIVKSYGTKTMIIIAIPFSHDPQVGIHVVSAFTGLNIENVISAGQLQNTENKTYCRLFTADGENLLNIQGEYPNGQNLFAIWKEKADFADGYSLEKVQEDWKNGREGYTVYSTEGTGSSYVYYKPIPGTDMILTSLMRESNINEVVRAGTQRSLRSSTVYLIIVVILLLVLFSMIIRVIQNARKDQRENDQLKIVGALSNDYSDIFLTDPL